MTVEQPDPSPRDRCASCGDALGHDWMSYSVDPSDPQKLRYRFSGFVSAGKIEPKRETPKRAERAFQYPDDLDVFFHTWCAPRITLPEERRKDIAEILAKGIAADWEETCVRWGKVGNTVSQEADAPRFDAHVSSHQGRRVFTLARAEWERLRSHEGKLVEISLERIPAGGVAEAASMIAALASECSIRKTQIEVWPYRENEELRLDHLQDYLVLENFTRQLKLPKFAERAATKDTPKLRKHLREHVFLVKGQADKGRWEPKARAVERIVFMTV